MIELYHVSDLHFQQNDSRDNGHVGPADLLRKLDAQNSIIAKANKYLMVTGDTTNTPDDADYDKARQSLLPSFAGKTYIVPGNHEYGKFIFAGFFGFSVQNANKFDAFTLNSLKFDHQYYPKDIYHTEIEEENDPGNKALMIGLNSCATGFFDAFGSRGKIGAVQLDQLDAFLKQYEGQKIAKIVLLHHVPKPPTDVWDLVVMRLVDWEPLRKILAKYKVDIVAYGHEGKMADISPLRRFFMRQKTIQSLKDQHASRVMEVQSVNIKADDKAATPEHRIIFLDADRSVVEQAYYYIPISNSTIDHSQVKKLKL